MREEKGRRLNALGLNQEYLEFLAKHRNENFQVNFILEAAGLGNFEEEKEETEEIGEKAKRYFKTIFKKAG